MKIKQGMVALTISLAMTNAFAASGTIGIATAKGNFRVDNSTVAGNATLFEGASVETVSTTGELRLAGARVAMAAGTKSTVFQDYVSLEQGKIQWSGGSAFRAKSGSLEVVGTGQESTALVVRKGNELQVAALTGTVNVMLSGGRLVKAVTAGTAFAFADPRQEAPTTGQAGQTAGTTAGTTADTATGTTAGTAAGTAGAAGAAGTVGAATGFAGMATGTLIAVGVGIVGAVAIPLAVVATRGSDTPTVSN